MEDLIRELAENLGLANQAGPLIERFSAWALDNPSLMRSVSGLTPEKARDLLGVPFVGELAGAFGLSEDQVAEAAAMVLPRLGMGDGSAAAAGLAGSTDGALTAVTGGLSSAGTSAAGWAEGFKFAIPFLLAAAFVGFGMRGCAGVADYKSDHAGKKHGKGEHGAKDMHQEGESHDATKEQGKMADPPEAHNEGGEVAPPPVAPPPAPQPEAKPPVQDNKAAEKALSSLQGNFSAADLVKALNLCSIQFETGSARLSQTSVAILMKASDVIKKAPKGTKIEVGGHTDNVGDPMDNLALSQERSRAVVTKLTGLGVDKAVLVGKGYGDKRPVADNKSDAGRKMNRRMAFTLMQ
jgi:outer membrane protein OmpA-like peptidoglycan-associated protein